MIGPFHINMPAFGDALELAQQLPDQSINCIVTSPPYWGLRDYGNDGQLGLEKTPEEYTEKMVALFRELRRALCDDGTLWLNLGDSYNSDASNQKGDRYGGWEAGMGRRNKSKHSGLKPKDLVGIPWRVAFALQADGWYLRSDIIWSKPNPMPESVTDRPTKAHEYLFLMSKSQQYFYDKDAVREAHSRDWSGGKSGGSLGPQGSKKIQPREGDPNYRGGHSQWERDAYPEPNPAGRNRRSVWTISTKPYPGAHFATFPPDLIKPCIMAGTSEKGRCSSCGEQWERVADRTVSKSMQTGNAWQEGREKAHHHGPSRPGSFHGAQSATIGWRCGCECDADPESSIVLDPFLGSGTTGMVCQDLGRKWIGFELNEDYAPLIEQRTKQIGLFG